MEQDSFQGSVVITQMNEKTSLDDEGFNLFIE